MTHLEQAIRDAVEKGGYVPSPQDYLNLCLDGKEWKQHLENYPSMLLNPAFWQALGKARGWNPSPLAGMEGYSGANLVPIWHSNWLVFIDHLAAGGDSETFFASLV